MQQFTFQIGFSVYVNYEGALFVCLCLSVCVCEKKDKTEKEVRPGENSFLKKADPKYM